MKSSTSQDFPTQGEFLSMDNWSPTPAFTLRRSAVSDAIRHWSPGNFLEAGIGTGSMTKLLLELGFTGYGFDITPANLKLAKANLERYASDFSLVDSLEKIAAQSVDYLFAFEVLEHIENDKAALASWTQYLRPGGKILISVPARMKKFRADDHFVGHVRRYEKQELASLLKSQGYQDVHIASYGVPLMNVSRTIGAWLHPTSSPGSKASAAISQVDRSILSGTERLDSINRISRLIGTRALVPFSMLQRAFYSKDWGEGYIATATLMPDSTTVAEPIIHPTNCSPT